MSEALIERVADRVQFKQSWTGANFLRIMELYEEIKKLIPLGAYDRIGSLAEDLEIQANTLVAKNKRDDDRESMRQAQQFAWFARDVMQTIDRGNPNHLKALSVDLFHKEVKRPRILRMKANVTDRFLKRASKK
jgi:hypothetical protein